MSKGSGRRKKQVSDEDFKSSWESIFDKSDDKEEEPTNDAEQAVLESITESNAD